MLQGILGSKAVLSIDGNRELLSAGQYSAEGIKVLSVESNTVEVEIDGKHRRLRMGEVDAVATPFKERKSVTVSISPDQQGMYATVGSINGMSVNFLVDTGATTIAMNGIEAKRLGIDYRYKGKQTIVGTASSVSKAYRVMLDTVSVGGITLNNITAVIMEGQFPVQILLGMSFLGQLEIQHQGSIMHLKKKL